MTPTLTRTEIPTDSDETIVLFTPARREPAGIGEAWGMVLQHWTWLRRLAHRMAECDRRLDADDFLHDLAADLVEAEPRLYDPARGSWRTWARTRARLARTRQLRVLNRQAPKRGRLSIGVSVEDGGSGDLPLGPGSRGDHDRAEARAELAGLYDRLPEHRDHILVALQGLSPAMVGHRSAAGVVDEIGCARF